MERFMSAPRDEHGKFEAPVLPDGSERNYLCATPIGVIARAFECQPFKLRSAAEMFPEYELESEYLNDFYMMDVILNRTPSPAASTGGGGGRGQAAVLSAMWYSPFCCATRVIPAMTWIIFTGRQSCSYLSLGFSTAIGTATLAMPGCGAR